MLMARVQHASDTRPIYDPFMDSHGSRSERRPTQEEFDRRVEITYQRQIKAKDEEIQLLKDQNEFLIKRIEDLKNYGALFKEYHQGNI